MNDSTFWQLLGEICEMGDFIAAVPNGVASANIVGHLSIGYDGGQKVLDKGTCHCHVHLVPEEVSRFNFTYLDAGFGSEPCVEVYSSGHNAILKLYYTGRHAREKFIEFTQRHADDSEFLSGSW